MGETTLDKETTEKVREWLLGRESDIAADWEDLGELRGLFVALIGREPKEGYA